MRKRSHRLGPLGNHPYLVALALAALAIGARWALNPWLGGRFPFITLFGAIAVAVWIGGYRAAILTALAGAIAVFELWLVPVGSLLLWTKSEVIALLAFAWTSGLIIVIGEALNRSRDRLETEASARREAVDARRVSEDFANAAFAQAAVGIAVADLSGRFLEANAKFCSILGYTPDEIRSRTFFDITHPDDLDRTRREASSLLAGQIPRYSFEKCYIRKDGSAVRCLATVTQLRDAAGRATRYVGVIDDITARVATEEALRRSEEFSRSIIESSRDCIKTLDRDGAIRWMSSTGQEALQIDDVNQVIGRRWVEFWPEAEREDAQRAVAEAAGGGTGRFVGTLELKGRKTWWNVVVTPVRDAAGTIQQLLAISRDVTERMAASELVREERRILEVLNRTGASLASQLDLKTIVQAVTDAGRDLSGAEFGAFFYNVTDARGDAFMLYTLSGAPREAFERFGHPRATALFGPTFRGEGVIRLHDVLADSRYAKTGSGMPSGHLPVRSYLAVPVSLRSGKTIGGLFFGHARPGVFDERAERIIVGLAAQAAVAIDNSMLYEKVSQAAEERKQLLESERAARGHAERLNVAKDQFLATLSHELRTPLGSILGWTQILRRPQISEEDRQRGLETIERNARAQAQLIDDLLDVSRITSGKVRLEARPVAPQAFVMAAIDTVRPAARAKEIDLEVLLDEAAPPITGDPGRLQQVVWNLLSNAVKFTPQKGRVRITLSRQGGNLQLTVSDSGMGIRPEFMSNIFDKFTQADSSTTRRFGGLGLGLAIVKHIVDMHGGSVRAVSGGEGLGATFVVELPLTSSLTVGDIRADSGNRSVKTTEFIPSELAGVSALVVDDDTDTRQLIMRVLQDCGSTVRAAHSAAHALEIIEGFQPDIVLSDIGMPDVDGFEFLRQLRASPHAVLKSVPVIALTAFARSEDRTRALRAGFSVHIAKPVEPSELVATVASVVGKARPEPGPSTSLRPVSENAGSG